MKLITCISCSDVVSLRVGIKRTCFCGKIWGEYLEDGLTARISKHAVPIGFENRSFVAALRKRPETGAGKEFLSFIIPKRCPTIQYEEEIPPLTSRRK